MKVLFGATPMNLETAIPALQARYPEVTFEACADRQELPEAIADAEVYMGWLNRELFLAARSLKWIQSPSTGVNGFLEIPELAQGEVLLTSARGTHSAALAESVLGMMLAFTRGIRASVLAQREHHWATAELRPQLVELTGGTLGLVGFGALGRALAPRAAAFGMRVLAVDLFTEDKPAEVEALWSLMQLDRLLEQSDYVVVTVPYTPATVGMIGAAQLARMKPSALLVGISRGGIIDEEALVEALRAGEIAAAALDVFATEPLPADSPLWDMENVLITAHIAGGTQYEGAHLFSIFEENLGRYLRGELPLRNQVDKQLGF